MVESASDEILSRADTSDVAFLVVGDPFGYNDPAAIPEKYTAILIKDHTEPPPIPTSSSGLENSTSRYKVSTMLLLCPRSELQVFSSIILAKLLA